MVTIIRSDDSTFTFDKFKIYGMSGFGGMNVELLTKSKAFGNGKILTGKRLPSRQLSIDTSCDITNLQQARIEREIVTRFFNPNYTYTIRVNYKDIYREIKCELYQLILPTNNIYKTQSMSLVFEALNPLFESVDKFGKDIASKLSTFGFPVYFLAERSNANTPSGANYGVFNFDNIVDINNDGHMPTHFTAQVEFLGDVTDFALHQNDTTFVKVNHTFKAGDILFLDFQESYASLNGENFNTNVDKDSFWFEIPLGESQIYFDTTIGATLVVVRLFYPMLYNGI